jgi:hypothetical protein
MGHAGLELRALGRTDYPAKAPMAEILMLARRCAGGVIFGFSQFQTDKGIWKQGTPDEKRQRGTIAFPTPWNHLEATVLYALKMLRCAADPPLPSEYMSLDDPRSGAFMREVDHQRSCAIQIHMAIQHALRH